MKIRNQALTSVRRTLGQAMGAATIQTVFNVALYLLQLDQDLAYFSNDMVLAIGDRAAFAHRVKRASFWR